jgi:hypothetical protein
MNAGGSPTEIVSRGYAWRPGTELTAVDVGQPSMH